MMTNSQKALHQGTDCSDLRPAVSVVVGMIAAAATVVVAVKLWTACFQALDVFPVVAASLRLW